MEREIVVKGRGQARSMPDRAVLDVRLEAEASTREEAYDQAAQLARQVDQVLARRADSIAQVHTAVLMVHPKNRWKRGESVRAGWRAARGSSVEVTELSHLGDLIAEITVAGGAVTGPTWRLDESNPAHREARRAAAEDARRRAEDYAGALGLVPVEVAWVSEPGLRATGGGHPGLDEARFRARGGAPAQAGSSMSEEAIDVTPAELVTEASVEVGFRLRPVADRSRPRADPGRG